ncbi:MAG: hypothetical protein NUV55_13410 [Sulfuricaulis sp.]|uniref:hypothetical protein n=1 Tax=Sulfuricaulis sp. TaxID=2003553 RepID=UPI0025DF892A|nr:hypothetical protein [Sulfuricaulis sp.]MCR4348180.1 hypothetical protein [Sulfuricaulis sp.]
MTDGTEKRLTEILKSLPAAQAGALLEFAEFLLIRHGVDGLEPVKNIAAVEIPKPLDIPRPAGETVVKAVKRLRVTYPMLDARKLLNQTSELMTQHLVQGREAVQVIEEMEILFRLSYEKLTVKNED